MVRSGIAIGALWLASASLVCAQAGMGKFEAVRSVLLEDGTSETTVTPVILPRVAASTRRDAVVGGAVGGASGIVYTCDPVIDVSVCNTLNTTIAAIYAATFTNVAASIYVEYGVTSLGQSQFLVNSVAWPTLRDALRKAAAGPDDAVAVATNVLDDNPVISGASVRLTGPLYRALGLGSATTVIPGVRADSTSCPVAGNPDCYNGIITISQSFQDLGRLYYRDGIIGRTQYDFYSVAEHETNEVLGVPSCLFSCNNRIFPADLFRYQSNGDRSVAAGNNITCSLPATGNACFSLDGVQMLQQFNNLNNGEDAGDWIPSCPGLLVQNAAACQGIANVDISPKAEIVMLDVIGYTRTANVLKGVDAWTSGQAVSQASCVALPKASDFNTLAPLVSVYGTVTGAHAGDSVRVVFVRPDGATYGAPFTTTIASVGPNGEACLSQQLLIAGTSAVTFPGDWTVRVFWNNATSALFTLTFRLALAPCTYSLNAGGAALASAGGVAVLAVSTRLDCSWSVPALPGWVTLQGAAPASGSGSVTLAVAANTGASRNATITVAGIPYNVEQEAATVPGLNLAGSLAHLVSQGGWAFTLATAKLGAAPVTARVDIRGGQGDPLTVPMTFPAGSPLSGSLGGANIVGATIVGATIVGASIDRTLNPNAQLVMNSTGPDTTPAASGWAQLLSTGNVSGFGIFSNAALRWNAAVPLETRSAASYILPFDNTGALATGIAVANVATAPASMPVVIRDDTGVQIDSASITLAAQGHDSFMLNAQYPKTAGKRGTIEFDTPPSGPISVLGVRANGSALTTLPVLANSDVAGGAIAHLTYNGGFTSAFQIVNKGFTAASFALNFFDEAGNPLAVPLLLPQTGAASTTSSLTQSLAPGAMLVVQTQAVDAAANISGSAQLITSGNISGLEIFRWSALGQEASVPFETRTPSGVLLIFDNTGNLTTGIALANVAPSAANVGVRSFDEAGALLQGGSFSLPGRGHTSFLLPDAYAVTAHKRGMIEFVVPSDGKISAIGVRATSDGTLTTIPVLTR